MTKNEEYQSLIVTGMRPAEALEKVFGKIGADSFPALKEQFEEERTETFKDEIDNIYHKRLEAK